MAQLSLPQAETQDTSLLHLQYGLMSAFPLLLPLLLGLALNLSVRRSGCGRVCISHLKWQRNSMLGLLTGFICWYLMPQGWPALALVSLLLPWFMLRIIKGWVSLIDGVDL